MNDQLLSEIETRAKALRTAANGRRGMALSVVTLANDNDALIDEVRRLQRDREAALAFIRWEAQNQQYGRSLREMAVFLERGDHLEWAKRQEEA